MTTMTDDLQHWLELRAWIERPDGSAPRRLIVEATVPEGGHIEAHEPPEPFLIPTVLEITTPDGVSAGPVDYPEPERRKLDWSPTVLSVLAGTVRFAAPLNGDASFDAADRTVTARLDYQGCIDGACLPPNAQTVEVALPRAA